MDYFLVLFFFFYLVNPSKAQEEQEQFCLLTNEKTGERWKLVWEDNFESNHIDSRKWTVADHTEDSQFCDSFLDCLSSSNVRLTSGFLLATTQFYEYENYTASKVTTPKLLKPGRLEIRARLPPDPLAVTRIQASLDSSQESFINVLVSFQEIYQSFQMQSKLMKSIVNEEMLGGEDNGFQVFGFEWTYGGLKFFWNEKYTKEMEFGKGLSTQMSQSNETLQLAIEVSYPNRRMHLFKGDLTSTLRTKLPSCTALVVDYVKMYERYLENTPGEQSNGVDCIEVRNERVEVEMTKLSNSTCELPVDQTTLRDDDAKMYRNLVTGKPAEVVEPKSTVMKESSVPVPVLPEPTNLPTFSSAQIGDSGNSQPGMHQHFSAFLIVVLSCIWYFLVM